MPAIKSKLASPGLAVLLVLGALALTGCGLIGGGGAGANADGGAADQTEPDISDIPPSIQTAQAEQPTDTPPPPSDAPPGATAVPTAGSKSLEEARTLLWAFLGRCFSFDPGDLEGYVVRGDWFVRATATGDFTTVGLWRVDASSGILEPQDPLARDWRQFVEDDCSEELVQDVLPTAPTATPSPLPTATPVAPTAESARNTLWAYLSQCSLSVDASDLRASAVLGDWFVQASTGDTTTKNQYGLWKVDVGQGDLTPHDSVARGLQIYVQSGCDAQVFEEQFPPTPTITPTPTPTPTATPEPTITPTPIPTSTPAPQVTSTTLAIDRAVFYLLPCEPEIVDSELEALQRPGTLEFRVSDKGTGDEVYGVWTVTGSDGLVTPANVRASAHAKRVDREEGC